MTLLNRIEDQKIINPNGTRLLDVAWVRWRPIRPASLCWIRKSHRIWELQSHFLREKTEKSYAISAPRILRVMTFKTVSSKKRFRSLFFLLDFFIHASNFITIVLIVKYATFLHWHSVCEVELSFSEVLRSMRDLDVISMNDACVLVIWKDTFLQKG